MLQGSNKEIHAEGFVWYLAHPQCELFTVNSAQFSVPGSELGGEDRPKSHSFCPQEAEGLVGE